MKPSPFRRRRRFELPMDRLQEQASHSMDRLRHHAHSIAGEARKKVSQGGDKLISLEKQALGHAREHPAPYLVAAGLALAGVVLIGWLLSEDRHRRMPRRSRRW